MISAQPPPNRASQTDRPRDVSNGLKSSGHEERPHPPRFRAGCLPEMGRKEEGEDNDENDARGLCRFVLVKRGEGFAAHCSGNKLLMQYGALGCM